MKYLDKVAQNSLVPHILSLSRVISARVSVAMEEGL